MRYTLTRHLVLGFTLLFLTSAVRPVLAQNLAQKEFHPEAIPDEPWVEEVPCRDDKEKVRHGFIGNREFRLCFDIDEHQLQRMPDVPSVRGELSITSYTKKGQPNLTQLKFARVFQDGHPGLILPEVTFAGPEQPYGSISRTVFKVPVQLTNESRTGRYPIEVEMTSGDKTAKQKIEFSLPILVPNGNSVVVEPQSIIDCWAGSKCAALGIQMQNKLPYKISIAHMSISSGDLLESEPIEPYRRDIEMNSPARDFPFVMQAKPMTLTRVLSGFGSPKATLTIEYKDEYGRPFWTQTPAKLEIRPNLLVILIFLLLGAVVGTLVKAYVEKLERSKLISREAAGFIVTTFVSGIIVCIVALLANIKLIVWNENSFSAWDPKVLFLTAMVATINGLPLLYERLKVSRSAAPPPAKDDNTRG